MHAHRPARPRRLGSRVALAALLACAGDAAATDLSIYTAPQRLVEVAAGRRINLVCVGAGSPTVVFDSGLAEPASTWWRVQPAIAAITRACAYDRAGVGFSDPGDRPGTSEHIVDDLRQLLQAAEIAPPYLLVAHSSGGMNMRLYYYRHPADVAGMVLVDPSHEDQTEGYRLLSPRGYTRAQWAALGAPGLDARRSCIDAAREQRLSTPGDETWKRCVFDPPSGYPPALAQAYLDMQRRPAFHQAQLTEEEHVFATSAAQLFAIRRSLLDLPVIVLTRSADPKPLRDWETAHLRAARERMWRNLHAALADSSSRGELRVVPDSDHAIQLSQPDAVIAAIRDMIDMQRHGDGTR